MMYQLRCKACLQVQRIEYDTVSISKYEAPHYCAYCGSDKVEKTQVESYWHDLAESMGFSRDTEGAQLVHALYDLWDTEKFSKFRDYVEFAKVEFTTESETVS